MTDPKTVCREVTRETHDFYCQYHVDFGDRGYEVLYGPPRHSPPILFVGYQPGGDQETDQHKCSLPLDPWPTQTVYVDGDWKLARELRAIWPASFLKECTGTNAIFFRSPSMSVFFEQVPGPVLVKTDRFCRLQLERIIDAVEPQKIVALGLATLRHFGFSHTVLSNHKGRSLVEIGTVAGREAYGVVHLSGARIAADDKRKIGSLMLGETM